MKSKNLIHGFFLVGAVSMMVMSWQYFQDSGSGILQRKIVKYSLLYKGLFYSHISTGLMAITIGPFQFFKSILARKVLHRKLGYIYCTAVVISSLAGLVIAQNAMGGIITRIGFSLLSIFWLISLMLALGKIRSSQIAAHQFWMQINYALTFAAITQRTLLLFALLPGFQFMPIYQLSAWLPWMLNVSIVVILKQKRTKLLA